jgi:cobalt-zinc-cadmium efflux system membrane fusion protein
MISATARAGRVPLVLGLALASAAASNACLACGRGSSRPEAPEDAGTTGAQRRGSATVHVDASLVDAGRIAVAPATRRALRGDVRVAAEVVPSEAGAADVGSLVSGRIATLEVREGEPVKRGQVLAYVDSPEAARIAADLIRARARVLGSSRKLERQLGLEQDRATSPAAVDEARMELATAEADAAAARTLLASLGLPEPPSPSQGALPARVPVRSPLEGVVVERTLDLGSPVSPDKTIFRVLARDQVIVEARWTDAATAPPPQGTKVSLAPRGAVTKATCEGNVASTVSMVDQATRARRVRIVPTSRCAFLVAGAYVEAVFTSASMGAAGLDVEAPALALPKGAVVDVRGAATVFVAGAEVGTFTARAVRVGRATADDVAIEEGLADGDAVVVDGAVLLKGELLRAELEAQ